MLFWALLGVICVCVYLLRENILARRGFRKIIEEAQKLKHKIADIKDERDASVQRAQECMTAIKRHEERESNLRAEIQGLRSAQATFMGGMERMQEDLAESRARAAHAEASVTRYQNHLSRLGDTERDVIAAERDGAPSQVQRRMSQLTDQAQRAEARLHRYQDHLIRLDQTEEGLLRAERAGNLDRSRLIAGMTHPVPAACFGLDIRRRSLLEGSIEAQLDRQITEMLSSTYEGQWVAQQAAQALRAVAATRAPRDGLIAHDNESLPAARRLRRHRVSQMVQPIRRLPSASEGVAVPQPRLGFLNPPIASLSRLATRVAGRGVDLVVYDSFADWGVPGRTPAQEFAQEILGPPPALPDARAWASPRLAEMAAQQAAQTAQERWAGLAGRTDTLRTARERARPSEVADVVRGTREESALTRLMRASPRIPVITEEEAYRRANAPAPQLVRRATTPAQDGMLWPPVAPENWDLVVGVDTAAGRGGPETPPAVPPTTLRWD